jgi:hypothetical protein
VTLPSGKRAERQDDACEPDNRVVARTLETRRNDKLAELERLEREHPELKQLRRLELNDLDRRRILGLADDLPSRRAFDGFCGEKPSGLGSFPVMSCYVIAPCSAILPC